MIWVGLLLPIMNAGKSAYTKVPTKAAEDSVEVKILQLAKKSLVWC